MNRLILLTALYVTTSLVYGQKKDLMNFINSYDVLRYSLYDQLNEANPMMINPETAETIKTFLAENKTKIVDYRNYILGKYLREDPENEVSKFQVDDSLREKVQKYHVFLGLASQGEMKEHPEIADLLEFLAVDPMLMLHSISGQIQSYFYIDQENPDTQKIAMLYAKAFIGGTYVTSEKIDKDNWKVSIYEHQYFSKYTFNVKSGKVSLESVLRRKT